MVNLNDVRKVHFIGIAGAGMRAIANVFIEKGYIVSGSDLKRSAITDKFAEQGARICIGQKAENLQDAEVVVISSAIRETNAEVVEARRRHIPVIHRSDALVHIISVVLISGSIILVGAIVLHPQGLSITAPAQLAELLVPIMGGAARYIMGFALLGAGFSSLLANTQRGMVLLGAGLDKDVGLETKFVRYGCLLFSMVVCYSYGGSPTQLILMANIATSIATPVGGLFILLLLWRKDVNEGYKKPTALRICMTISYVFVLIMTASALSGYLPKIAALFA